MQLGSGSNALKNEPPMDFKPVDVRLLSWPLSGQAVTAVVENNSGCAVRAAQHPAAGGSSFSPSFIHSSLPSSKGPVYAGSSAAGGECYTALYMPCVISPVNA